MLNFILKWERADLMLHNTPSLSAFADNAVEFDLESKLLFNLFN